MDHPSQYTAAVRRRRNRAEVLELIKSFVRSGQSLREFCRQHEVSKSTMANMLRRHQTSASQHDLKPVTSRSKASSDFAAFVPVEIVATAPESSSCLSSLVVELPRGLRVLLDRDFDAMAFERLLAVVSRV
jgi:transposase-like protein